MINSVCISGYLASSPRYFEDRGYCLATINVPRPDDEFFYVIAYGDAARVLSTARFGDLIVASGTLRSRQYREGDVVYLRTEVRITQVQIFRQEKGFHREQLG
ncbi:MAG: single-stranded DNA-binding protein [candidate division KSB1 bacterium]|nr:single-stranded DNA-binding protein [candidate division KSB1 bacterium]